MLARRSGALRRSGTAHQPRASPAPPRPRATPTPAIHRPAEMSPHVTGKRRAPAYKTLPVLPRLRPCPAPAGLTLTARTGRSRAVMLPSPRQAHRSRPPPATYIRETGAAWTAGLDCGKRHMKAKRLDVFQRRRGRRPASHTEARSGTAADGPGPRPQPQPRPPAPIGHRARPAAPRLARRAAGCVQWAAAPAFPRPFAL